MDEVRFRDIDLAYIFAYDLGKKVKAQELAKWFTKRFRLPEGFWLPPEDIGISALYHETPGFVLRLGRELGIISRPLEDMTEKERGEEVKRLLKDERIADEAKKRHSTFIGIISEDKAVLDPEYLELTRYARLKLTDLNIKVTDPEFEELHDRELKCELYLLIHDVGIAIATAWIHLDEDLLDKGLSTDQVNKMHKLYAAKCSINDSFREYPETSLPEYINDVIHTRLSIATVFWDEYGDFDAAFNAFEEDNIKPEELEKRLRTAYCAMHRIVCVRKHDCQYNCKTAKEAVEKHPLEFHGILTASKAWRIVEKSAARKKLRPDLSDTVDMAFFMTAGGSLWVGSPMLGERMRQLLKDEKEENIYRVGEVMFAVPVEFSILTYMMVGAYYSYLNRRIRELEYGRAVRPREIASLKREVEEGLEEYRNVIFTNKEPANSVVESSKKRLLTVDVLEALRERLSVLDDYIRTAYDEAITAKNEEITRKQHILTILFGIVGIAGVMEVTWDLASAFLPPIAAARFSLLSGLTTFALILIIYKYHEKIKSFLSSIIKIIRHRKSTGG